MNLEAVTGLEVLQALKHAIKSVPGWIKNFRDNYPDPGAYMAKYELENVCYNNKPYCLIKTVTKEDYLPPDFHHLFLEKGDAELGVAVVGLAHHALKALLKFEGLFYFLYTNGSIDKFPDYYQWQRQFVINELKWRVQDALCGSLSPINIIYYDLIVSLEDPKCKVYNSRMTVGPCERSLNVTSNVRYNYKSAYTMEKAFSLTKNRTVH